MFIFLPKEAGNRRIHCLNEGLTLISLEFTICPEFTHSTFTGTRDLSVNETKILTLRELTLSWRKVGEK